MKPSRPAPITSCVPAATVEEVQNLLDALATRLEPVEIRFLWRPQLKDADDEMVLETAVNGRAEAIVTFNRRDSSRRRAASGSQCLRQARSSTGADHGNEQQLRPAPARFAQEGCRRSHARTARRLTSSSSRPWPRSSLR